MLSDPQNVWCSLGARRLGGIQNSLFGEGLVKAEEFRIPERLVTFDTV